MKIAVIGSGNMGGALVKGWCKAGLASDITITARSQATLECFTSLYPQLAATTDNVQAVSGADLVVLAVKPWLVAEVVQQIQPALDAGKALLVSVAAGVRNARINVYAMPNIAVQYMAGMTFVEEAATCEINKVPKNNSSVPFNNLISLTVLQLLLRSLRSSSQDLHQSQNERIQ